MIMSGIFIENMRTWTETVEFTDLGEKKLRNVGSFTYANAMSLCKFH